MLFLTNLAGIVVTAGLFMTIQGYARWKRAVVGLLGALAASIFLMQPLNEECQTLRVKTTVLRLVKTLPATSPGYREVLKVETLRVRHQDGMYFIHAEGSIPKDWLDGYVERLELYRRELEEMVGEPVVIELEAVPVDVLRFRAAPDG